MPFTFNNYANNELQKSPLNDLIGNLLGGYQQGVQAKYLGPSLAEHIKKAQLYNQYYAPQIESEIGLRKAQTGEAGARTGLISEQNKGMRIENQYLPEYKRAQIEQLRANSENARLLQMIREQLLGGGSEEGTSGQDSFPLMQMYQGAAGNDQGAQPTNRPQTARLPSYAQAAIAGQALGLGMPKIVDANGKYVAISPFGVVDTGVRGLTEQQKSLAKEDAKKISTLENTVLNNQYKMDTFNELNEILGSPDFEAIRQLPAAGGLENWVTGKFGTKAQQNLVGRANTLMGNIIKDSARDFAGQFRVGEQALLNGMKPNPGDSLDVMKGKSEALTYLTQMMTKRSELEADYMRNYGMPPLQAKIAADKKIDAKAIKEDIRTILHPTSSQKVDITPEEAIAELKRRQARGIK